MTRSLQLWMAGWGSKVVPWMLLAAFGYFCWLLWGSSRTMIEFNADFHGRDLPGQNSFLRIFHQCVLFLPIPWLVYALILTFRREMQPGAVWSFTQSIGIAFGVVLFAFLLAGFVFQGGIRSSALL